jgi:hypothetical protein
LLEAMRMSTACLMGCERSLAWSGHCAGGVQLPALCVCTLSVVSLPVSDSMRDRPRSLPPPKSDWTPARSLTENAMTDFALGFALRELQGSVDTSALIRLAGIWQVVDRGRAEPRKSSALHQRRYGSVRIHYRWPHSAWERCLCR